MDIPYEVLDFTEEFQEKIMEKFVRVYQKGGTPNPCIDCNRYMKFDKLMRAAEEYGCEKMVTGHYARIEYNEKTGRYELKKAVDAGKDQSYVLYAMTQEQLAHTAFPLGGLKKSQVRELAEKLSFVNAHKHDSQDICFVPDGDYAAFIEQFTGEACPVGNFVDQEGKILGQHKGAIRYTIGQRKGLNLAMQHPVYVCRKNMMEKTVTVGPESALYTDTLTAEEVNWISIASPEQPLKVKAMTRYRKAEQPAVVYPLGPDRFRLVFEEPQRAITPGQAVVLYDGDVVVGGGTITGTWNSREKGEQP